jgi:hypothetical protein
VSTRRQDNPPTSPWPWSSGSDANGGSITASFAYNESTHALISLTTVRTSTLWTHVEVGLGAQKKTLPVPLGQRTFTAAEIAAATGFTSIDEIWALNFTVA